MFCFSFFFLKTIPLALWHSQSRYSDDPHRTLVYSRLDCVIQFHDDLPSSRPEDTNNPSLARFYDFLGQRALDPGIMAYVKSTQKDTKGLYKNSSSYIAHAITMGHRSKCNRCSLNVFVHVLAVCGI